MIDKKQLWICSKCNHVYEYNLDGCIIVSPDNSIDTQIDSCSITKLEKLQHIMATPAFIYGFDNLSPGKFVELCGLLLAERYKGFLLGGIGPDGGIDGEIDNILGIWRPEAKSPLESLIVEAEQSVIFQFKHKVVGRLGGQTKARQELLTLYKDYPKKPSELKRSLVIEKKPDVSAILIMKPLYFRNYNLFKYQYLKLGIQC